MYTLLLLFGSFEIAFGQCILGDDAYVGGLCYTASTYKDTFQNAEFACNGRAQSLAIIQNSAQANNLATLVHKISGEQNGVFWIGLKRQTTGSRFQWDDGTPLTWSNFDPSYPQNNLYVAESTTNGKWRTLDGQESHYFVCSYDPKKLGSTTLSPWSTTRNPGGSTNNPGGTTNYPCGTSDYPDDATYHPGGTTNYPWGTTDYPWGTTDYPGGSTDDPWGSTNYPDGTTDDPFETTYNPCYPPDYSWGTTNYPGGTTYYPWGTTYYPGGTTNTPPATISPPPGTTANSRFENLPEALKKLLRNYKP